MPGRLGPVTETAPYELKSWLRERKFGTTKTKTSRRGKKAVDATLLRNDTAVQCIIIVLPFKRTLAVSSSVVGENNAIVYLWPTREI